MSSTKEVQILPITTPLQREEWDHFAGRSSVGHMQQCRWWADPLEEIGVGTHILGCWKNQTLIGGALFALFRFPF